MTMPAQETCAVSILERWSQLYFNWVHTNNLIYNQCWEDPRLDRKALDIQPDDTILVITSAGCNALDYVLMGPERVYAVDMNPRQNAVLELKMAGIRNLDYATFFQLFGRGRLADFDRVYESHLRGSLTKPTQHFWDRHRRYFRGEGFRKSFYFYGSSGYFAWLVNLYLRSKKSLREGVREMLGTTTVDEQREVYETYIRQHLWNQFIRWAIGRDATLAMVGVPKAQRKQVERYYEGGIAQFMNEAIESVFARLPFGDNYFWRVYLTGEYTPECCPEYLKENNFYALKDGLIDRVHVETNTLQGFLDRGRTPISKFVLLDHMDWMASHVHDALVSEWETFVACARPGSRVIWRSGGLDVDYVDPMVIRMNGAKQRVGELLTYHHGLAAELHTQDRVHTYGSFYIADLATA